VRYFKVKYAVCEEHFGEDFFIVIVADPEILNCLENPLNQLRCHLSQMQVMNYTLVVFANCHDMLLCSLNT